MPLNCLAIVGAIKPVADMLMLDHFPVADDGGVRKQVPQFSYVTWPVMDHHPIESCVRKTLHEFALLPQFVKEMLRKLRYILGALA